MRFFFAVILGASLSGGGTAFADTVIPPIVSISTWGEPVVPLNHRGLVRFFRIEAEDVSLRRQGEAPADIALGEELADGFFTFNPGPLVEGEVLSLAVECSDCDGEPFEAVVGGFVDEGAPVLEITGDVFFDDEVQRIPNVPIALSDDFSPALALIAEVDDGAHLVVAGERLVGPETTTRFVAPDGPARDMCFRLSAIDWAGNRSEPTARSCVAVGASGGCASTPFALPVALVALAIVRRRASLRG